MGMFMASVAFRRNENADWEAVKAEIEKYCTGVDELVSNLDQDIRAYAVVSPYGEQGALLAKLACTVSEMIDDYAVMATCVDSDFNILELYYKGRLIEHCCIGEVYDEYFEAAELTEPSMENWMQLLINPAQEDALYDALFGENLFAEDQLRKLSTLTGMPIFDDELVQGDRYVPWSVL